MGYDRGDNFPFDFLNQMEFNLVYKIKRETVTTIISHSTQFSFRFSEPNGIQFGSENRKENCHHNHIPFNLKGNGNIVFFSVGRG